MAWCDLLMVVLLVLNVGYLLWGLSLFFVTFKKKHQSTITSARKKIRKNILSLKKGSMQRLTNLRFDEGLKQRRSRGASGDGSGEMDSQPPRHGTLDMSMRSIFSRRSSGAKDRADIELVEVVNPFMQGIPGGSGAAKTAKTRGNESESGVNNNGASDSRGQRSSTVESILRQSRRQSVVVQKLKRRHRKSVVEKHERNSMVLIKDNVVEKEQEVDVLAEGDGVGVDGGCTLDGGDIGDGGTADAAAPASSAVPQPLKRTLSSRSMRLLVIRKKMSLEKT